MADTPHLVYWDSCVFIDGLRQTPGRFEQVDALQQSARRGDIVIVTSTFTMAEVVRAGSGYSPLSDKEARSVRQQFENRFVRLLPVDRPIARLARNLAQKYPIKPPDAVQVATAIRSKSEVMFTYDGDGGKPNGLLSLNIAEAPPIRRPEPWGQMMMQFAARSGDES